MRCLDARKILRVCVASSGCIGIGGAFRVSNGIQICCVVYCVIEKSCIVFAVIGAVVFAVMGVLTFTGTLVVFRCFQVFNVVL